MVLNRAKRTPSAWKSSAVFRGGRFDEQNQRRLSTRRSAAALDESKLELISSRSCLLVAKPVDVRFESFNLLP